MPAEALFHGAEVSGRVEMTVAAQPYAPVLSAAEPGYLTVRPISVTFRSKHGVPDFLETSSSYVILARLRAAAAAGDRVTHFAHDGLELDADSVAALNCYLRTAKAMGRFKLPWDRLPESGNHRYAWAAFCEHLGLQFR